MIPSLRGPGGVEISRRLGDMSFAEAHGDRFNDLFMDFFDCQIAFNDDNAVRFAGGDFAVFLPYAAVKGILLLLEAPFIFAGLQGGAIVAAAGAVETLFERG